MAQPQWRALVGVSVLALVASTSAQTPRDARTNPVVSGSAIIEGRVTVPVATGATPVRRARVTLEGDALREPLVADTDTDGRYHFDQLAAGRYRLLAAKDGFTPDIADPRRAFQPPASFEVVAGAHVTRDIVFRRGAAISGVLLKPNGDPAINVVVSAVRVGYSELGRTPIAVRSARTNDLGRFRVHSLPAGDYLVDAAQDPLEAANQIRAPGPRPPALARTYFPGSARLEDGRLVTVAVGQDLGAVDFTMTTTAVGSLAGAVVNAQGDAQKGAGLRIQRVGGPVGEVRGFSSMQDNTFGFSLVPPGDYWVMAVARPQPNAPMEFGVVKFHADGLDVKDFRVAVAPGVAVSGRVEPSGGARLPGGVQVLAAETSYSLPGVPGQPAPTWTAPVAADGAFTFDSLFGPRLFRVVGLPDDWAIRGVWAGDREISDTPVDITPVTPLAPLRIVLTSETVSLVGTARNSSGAPVANARIVVIGGDERAWGPWTRVVKTVESGPDGRFEIKGILPGDYAVAGATFLDDMAWFHRDVLSQLRTNARPLSLPSPGRITSDVVVR